MVSIGVLGTVLLKRGLVFCETSLTQGERLLTAAHLAETASRCRLEGLIGSEVLLEVHPVLSSVSEFFLKDNC